MARKKWYVVIVGTSVGVFSNWLEVSPLITGVSGARHQSFATKEEALHAFSVECAKGRVKVVDADESSCGSSIASSPTSSRTPRRSQTFSHFPQSPSVRRHDGLSPAATVQTPSGLSHYPSNRSTNSRTTSMSSRGTNTGRISPLTVRSPHIRSDADVNMSPSSRSHINAIPPAATVQTPSGLSHYPSNRSTNSRTTSRGTNTGRISPLTVRSPHIRSDADVNMSPSSRSHISAISPATTVQTPSGLSYYPSNRSTNSRTTSVSSKGANTGQLSPLTLRSPTVERIRPDGDVNMTPSSSRSHVSARSFRSPGGQLQVSISFPVPECANCSRKAEEPCEDALSNAFSQMHVNHNTVHDKQIDPRSPIPGISYLPLSTNTISFGRPSPSRTPGNDSVLFRQHN